jgi:hypothetical protein
MLFMSGEEEKMEVFNRNRIINNMCMTFRHDYGLMEEREGQALFNKMEQIFKNDIEYHLMTLAQVENYEEIIGELENKLEKLEKDRDYWKLSFHKQVEATR